MTTLRLFFAWPTGGTWSNVVAAVECGVPAAVAAWVGRHRIGRALARWWRSHHDVHGHITAEIEAAEARLKDHITEQLQGGPRP